MGRTRLGLCTFALGLMTTACSTPTDPSLRAFQGVFVLQTVDGLPLPVVQNAFGQAQLRMRADTLGADGRGHYVEIMRQELDSLGNSYRAAQASRHTGHYTVRGDTVDFEIDCPAPCMRVLQPLGVLQ